MQRLFPWKRRFFCVDRYGGVMPFTDHHGRAINYLRVSVTDRCNYRCLYCMPPEGVPFRSHHDILRYEEIERIVRAAANLGIRRVRLTGGEPLVRAGVVSLVAMLAAIPGIEDLSMTTNGALLDKYATDLRDAGLMRVNISLDTLRPERYAMITRGGDLADVWAGIASAERVGLHPLKINTVVVRGLNDDEMVDIARLTLEHDWYVRFIELMPLSEAVQTDAQGYVPSDDVRAAIVSALGPLQEVESVSGSGPAEYYRLPGAPGCLGFISPISQHFCGHCNRLRLTADGRLRPCLLSDSEIDLKAALRSGASIEALQELIERAVMAKPTGHRLTERVLPHGRVMSQIGG